MAILFHASYLLCNFALVYLKEDLYVEIYENYY